MAPAAHTAIPDRLGPYVLGSVIGVGAAAVVVAARDSRLDADVAIKLLRSADPEIRERFLREARLLRRVSHPAVVAVHDVGETPDGRPFLVMDLAQCSLSDRLRTATPPADALTLRTVAHALATGLGALHRAGIVHRDVKPANLLLLTDVASGTELANGAIVGPDERVIIGDLGFAKDQRLVNPGTTLLGGTPGFRAPEQLEYGQRVDARADVYAATAVLWMLVTGRPPPSVDTVDVDVQSAPAPWRDIVRTGMAADPAARFPDMAGWAVAVDAAIGGPEAPVARAAAVPASTLPYKGLAAFQPEDAALFFGRAELVDHLLTRLTQRNVLVVGGASGSGKSSVVRAGLIPRLEAGALPGSADRRTCLITPGEHPMRSLGEVPSAALLVVDQFEELFTLCRDADEQERFLGTLAELSGGARPVAQVVLVVRADFYAACAARPWLAEAINANQVLVPPMSRDDLRAAIEGPARRVGLHLQDHLIDRILNDAGEDPGGLPLLSHALAQTWLRREGDVLTLAGYLAAGGVEGAVQRSADEVWLHLEDADRPVARRLLLRLVQPGDGTPDTRRILQWSDLGDRHRALVTRFAEARLLTVDADGVRLAHEAVLRSWPTLTAWLAEERDDLRAGRRLEEAAADWRRADGHPDLLLRGMALSAAVDWNDRQEGDIPFEVAQFLTESLAAQATTEEAERSRAARAARLRRRVLTTLVTLTTLAVLASVIAVVGLARSRHDARVARAANAEAAAALAETLATSAQSLADSRPHRATELAVQALAGAPGSVAARDALVRARLALAGDRLVPVGEPLQAPGGLAVGLAPSGNSAAVGRRDGSVWVWDNLKDASPPMHLHGPTGGVQSVAYTADGATVVAGSADGTVWAWDVNSGAGRKVADTKSIVWAVAAAPNGTTVAAGTASGQVWLLDARTGAPLGDPSSASNGEVMSLAFAEAGAVLLSGSGKGEVTAWSVSDRSTRWTTSAGRSRILDLTACQTCATFVTVSSAGVARVWDVADGKERPRPDSMPDGIRGASLSADGTTLTLGAADGALHSWPLAGGAGDRAPAHRDRVIGLAGTADGLTVVSLSDDQTVQRWTRAPRPSPITRIASVGATNSMAIAPGAEVLAVGRADGSVVVLDAATGAERAVLREDSRPISSVAFLDANRLVTGDDAGTLRVWDLSARRVAAVRPDAHRGSITAVHALDDGRLLSAGADRTVRLWPADLSSPTGHQQFAAPLTDLTADPDGSRVIAVGRTGEVDQWEPGDGKVERIASLGDTAWTVDLAGSAVVVGGADELVSAWTLGDGAAAARWQAAHADGALALTVVGGTTVATGAENGRLHLVDLETGSPIGAPLTLGDAPGRQVLAHGAVAWTVDRDGAVHRIDALDAAVAAGIAGR